MLCSVSLCFFRLGFKRNFELQHGQKTSDVTKYSEQVVHRFWPFAYLKILNFSALYFWHIPLQVNDYFFVSFGSCGLYSILFLSSKSCSLFISTSFFCILCPSWIICIERSSQVLVEISLAFWRKITSSFLFCARNCSTVIFWLLNLFHRMNNYCNNCCSQCYNTDCWICVCHEIMSISALKVLNL